MVKSNGYQGTFAWEISGDTDDFELLKAMDSNPVVDTNNNNNNNTNTNNTNTNNTNTNNTNTNNTNTNNTNTNNTNTNNTNENSTNSGCRAPIYSTYINKINSWWPPTSIAADLDVQGYARDTKYNEINFAFWTVGGGALDIALLWEKAAFYFTADNPWGKTDGEV